MAAPRSEGFQFVFHKVHSNCILHKYEIFKFEIKVKHRTYHMQDSCCTGPLATETLNLFTVKHYNHYIKFRACSCILLILQTSLQISHHIFKNCPQMSYFQSGRAARSFERLRRSSSWQQVTNGYTIAHLRNPGTSCNRACAIIHLQDQSYFTSNHTHIF